MQFNMTTRPLVHVAVGQEIEQGDVTLRKLADKPVKRGAKVTDLLVKHGEGGHSHVLLPAKGAQVQLLDPDKEGYGKDILMAFSVRPAKGTEAVPLRHEEHDGLLLDEGVWGLVGVVEIVGSTMRQQMD